MGQMSKTSQGNTGQTKHTGNTKLLSQRELIANKQNYMQILDTLDLPDLASTLDPCQNHNRFRLLLGNSRMPLLHLPQKNLYHSSLHHCCILNILTLASCLKQKKIVGDTQSMYIIQRLKNDYSRKFRIEYKESSYIRFFGQNFWYLKFDVSATTKFLATSHHKIK